MAGLPSIRTNRARDGWEMSSLMSLEAILSSLTLLVVAGPVGLMACFLPWLSVNHQLSEVNIARVVKGTIGISLLSAVCAAGIMLSQGLGQHAVELGDWVVTRSFHLKFKFVLDLLSLTYVILTLVLCATIGAFATRYLHREHGYNRFFVLFGVFLLGMVIAALSDTVETLFIGWELVGLSSVLLIAFFHERPGPARNGLRVWVVYRICDAALMLAAVMLHEIQGGGDFDHLVGPSGWPHNDALTAAPHLAIVGLLFVIAAAGKSALAPFSGWLPRAMEGPTPSSAIFYGALSVHLGAFLLLRINPVLDSAPWLSALVVTLGLSSAVFAYLSGRVQTDIKSALSFASLTQVGIIFTWIGLGLNELALIHLVGHACLRTLQFLRAPSLLHDHHQLENAIGARLGPEKVQWEQRLSPGLQRGIYRFGLERGYLDSLLDALIARPFVGLFKAFDAAERGWTGWLNAEPAAKPKTTKERA
jgi:NADH:ubiquinone oxidoreductase subunit 5 (subunit L)/multisubunit Na+/H+ antiporter MnhA subunit